MRTFTQGLKRDLDLVVCVLALITHDAVMDAVVITSSTEPLSAACLSVAVIDVTAPAHEL